MSQPLFDRDGNLIATIQLQSKFKLIGEVSSQLSSKPNQKKLFSGFNLVDEEVMKILSEIIKVKLESQMVIKRCRSLENEVIVTLKVAG